MKRWRVLSRFRFRTISRNTVLIVSISIGETSSTPACGYIKAVATRRLADEASLKLS